MRRFIIQNEEKPDEAKQRFYFSFNDCKLDNESKFEVQLKNVIKFISQRYNIPSNSNIGVQTGYTNDQFVHDKMTLLLEFPYLE
jgi:hypothetical protein